MSLRMLLAREIKIRIGEIKEALPFLGGEDREIVNNKIEEYVKLRQKLFADEKPRKGKKEKLARERVQEWVREYEDSKREIAKVQQQEYIAKMLMMKEMVAKGFTFDQIKAWKHGAQQQTL